MAESIINGFLIFGIIEVFLFVGLFVSKKDKRSSADLIISAFLLVFAVHSLLVIVNLNTTYSKLIQTIPITLTLLYGPLLLKYIETHCPKTIHGKRNLLWHLIPFGTFLALTFLYSECVIFNNILALSGAVSGLLYCLISLSKLRKHAKYISDQFSSTKGVSLNWINKLVTGIICIWTVVLVLVIFKRLFQLNIPINWFFTTIPLFIAYIGYHGLKQQLISDSNTSNDNDIREQNSADVFAIKKQKPQAESAYKKSGLQKEDFEIIFSALENAMTNKQLFLEPSLSLKELSSKVEIPQHHITQTLNSFAEQSFYDYVNTYRVKYFIDKLKKGEAEKLSLLGIAFDCGFNSKSSFNRIFKKHTSCSPSEYKSRLS